MPYIKQEMRDKIDDDGLTLEKPGELNYVISSLCDEYISQNSLSYTTINELIGALECAKLELYRRVAAPYEKEKLSKNGEVYHRAMSLMPKSSEKEVQQETSPSQLELFPDAEQATLTGEAKYGETKFG